MRNSDNKDELDRVLSAKDELEQQLAACRGRGGADKELHQNEVSQLEQRLKQYKKKAASALDVKDRFLRMMSHEIRTPMNAISGMAHLMLDTVISEQQKRYLQNILSSSEVLKGLMFNLLDLSNIQSGSLEYRDVNFNLPELISKVMQTYRLLAEDKGLEFKDAIEKEFPNWVCGDPQLLEKIIHVWVNNAIKFTKKGEISLTVGMSSRTGDKMMCKLEVSDTGVGIGAVELNNIFEIFEQGDSSVHLKYGGAGVGLALSKQLADLCEAKIEVRSTVGVGSCFTLLFPLMVVEDCAANEQGDLLVKKDEKCVLVAEDNVLNQQYLCRLLDKWSIAYDLAENGLEAVVKSSEKTYDLILMDVQMPELDGNKATAKIRSMGKMSAQIPILGLSAYAFQQDIQNSLNAGMNGYLTKPYSPIQLKNILKRYMQNLTDEVLPLESFQLGALFDKESLEIQFDGDLEYMLKVFNTFERHVPKSVEELVLCRDAKEWSLVSKLAHQLKTSFSIIGIIDCADLLRMIERNCQSENLSSSLVDVQINDFLERFYSFLPLFKEEVARLKKHLKIDFCMDE